MYNSGLSVDVAICGMLLACDQGFGIREDRGTAGDLHGRKGNDLVVQLLG